MRTVEGGGISEENHTLLLACIWLISYLYRVVYGMRLYRAPETRVFRSSQTQGKENTLFL